MKLFQKFAKCCREVRRKMPLIVGIVSLVATLVSFNFMYDYETHYTEANIAAAVEDLEHHFNDRIALYQSSVYGALGLFNSSEQVTRSEWGAFVESTQMTRQFPGVLGLGFAKYFKQSEIDVVVQQVRNEGFPDFKIFPEGERPEYASIIYLEPFDQRNQRAFGYDMFSEQVRRTAMETARDSGDFSISGKVKLVQQLGEDQQPAFLIYMPVYKDGQIPQSVQERREKLDGYIYSPVLMNDFGNGIKLEANQELEFQIFDSAKEGIAESNMLYSSGLQTFTPGYAAKYSELREVKWGGKTWTLRFVSKPGFGLSPMQQAMPWIVLVLGLICTGGLVVFVWINTNESPYGSQKLANDLAQTKIQLENRELVIDNEPFGLIVTDHSGKITVFNLEAERRLGYLEKDAVQNLNFLNLITKTELAHRTAQLVAQTGIKVEPSFDTVVTDSIVNGESKTEWTFVTEAGKSIKLDVLIKPLYDQEKKLLGYQFVI